MGKFVHPREATLGVVLVERLDALPPGRRPNRYLWTRPDVGGIVLRARIAAVYDLDDPWRIIDPFGPEGLGGEIHVTVPGGLAQPGREMIVQLRFSPVWDEESGKVQATAVKQASLSDRSDPNDLCGLWHFLATPGGALVRQDRQATRRNAQGAPLPRMEHLLELHLPGGRRLEVLWEPSLWKSRDGKPSPVPGRKSPPCRVFLRKKGEHGRWELIEAFDLEEGKGFYHDKHRDPRCFDDV